MIYLKISECDTVLKRMITSVVTNMYIIYHADSTSCVEFPEWVMLIYGFSITNIPTRNNWLEESLVFRSPKHILSFVLRNSNIPSLSSGIFENPWAFLMEKHYAPSTRLTDRVLAAYKAAAARESFHDWIKKTPLLFVR